MMKKIIFYIALMLCMVMQSYAGPDFPDEDETITSHSFHISGKPLILHAGMEGPHAILGGLGSVVRDTVDASRAEGSNAYSCVLWYHFLRTEFGKKGIVPGYVGQFQHFAFGEMKTTKVYYNKQNAQFLFQPDLRNSDIADTVRAKEVLDVDGAVLELIPGKMSIYGAEYNYNRVVYFGSAIAGFANAMHASVVQLHGWHTALAAPLINKIYAPLRASEGKMPIKTVAVIHMLNGEQGFENKSIYTHVGLGATGNINLCATAIIECDQVITVSAGLLQDICGGKAYGLDGPFREKTGNLIGIRNGIQYANYDLRSPSIFKDFSLSRGFTCADLQDQRAKVKQLLAGQGLIGDHEKSLLLYVGRFSAEKGIDRFPAAIESWTALGGQVVLMGIVAQDAPTQKFMAQLKKKYTGKADVKIYTDLMKDQIALLGETGVKKGNLLRSAADWGFIPSKAEACGLVAMELLTASTPLVTSWVQGLKDMCFPLDKAHPLTGKAAGLSDFNALSYWEHDCEEATQSDIKWALIKAFSIQKHFPAKYWDACYRMVQNSDQYDWRAPDGPIAQYQSVYKSLTYLSRPDEAEAEVAGDLISHLLRHQLLYPEEKLQYRNGQFILGTPVTGESLLAEPLNLPDIEKKSLSVATGGQLYFNGTLADTKNIKSTQKDFHETWVLSKNGELHLGAFCHAYFVKGVAGEAFHGYGRPIACGGDIRIENGKIVYIDNRSGHYMPSYEQFLLALNHLKDLGVLGENVEVRNEETGMRIAPRNFDRIIPEHIFQHYTYGDF